MCSRHRGETERLWWRVVKDSPGYLANSEGSFGCVAQPVLAIPKLVSKFQFHQQTQIP